jgi:hypothetical protein
MIDIAIDHVDRSGKIKMSDLDFDRPTAGLDTKSEKIRALSRGGVPTSEIARYLGIRYQHARNVLVQAGLHRTAKEQASVGQSSSTDPESTWVQVGADGRVPVPPKLLERAGLGSEGFVYVGVTDDGLELLSQAAALARAQALLAPYKRPGVSEVDEFIAERRREAEPE